MRTIDGDALYSELAKQKAFGMLTAKSALRAVANALTIEPELIYCKDCKFYTPMRSDLKTGICSLASRHLGDDGFCSEGEKK